MLIFLSILNLKDNLKMIIYLDFFLFFIFFL